MTDDELISEFIANRGVTKLPTAFTDRSSGSISQEDRDVLKAHSEKLDEIRKDRIETMLAVKKFLKHSNHDHSAFMKAWHRHRKEMARLAVGERLHNTGKE